MKNLLVIVTCVLLLTSCGKKLALNPATTNGKHFSAEMSALPPFGEYTMEMNLTDALIGAQGMRTSFASTHLQRNDPTEALLDGASDILKEKYGMTFRQDSPDYHLKATTTNWGIIHHLIAVTLYKIYYNASIEILEKDSTARKFFWCHYGTDSIYTYDEVYAHNAKLVETEVEKGVKQCTKEFSEWVDKEIAKDTGKALKQMGVRKK